MRTGNMTALQRRCVTTVCEEVVLKNHLSFFYMSLLANACKRSLEPVIPKGIDLDEEFENARLARNLMAECIEMLDEIESVGQRRVQEQKRQQEEANREAKAAAREQEHHNGTRTLRKHRANG